MHIEVELWIGVGVKLWVKPLVNKVVDENLFQPSSIFIVRSFFPLLHFCICCFFAFFAFLHFLLCCSIPSISLDLLASKTLPLLSNYSAGLFVIVTFQTSWKRKNQRNFSPMFLFLFLFFFYSIIETQIAILDAC